MPDFTVLGFIFFCALQLQALEMKGVASTPDGKKLLYTEHHTIEVGENGLSKKIQTKYYNGNEKLIAEIVSDFSKHPTIPETRFTDLRFDRNDELTVDEKNQTVIFKSTQNGQTNTSKPVAIKKNMAAAQGFDSYKGLSNIFDENGKSQNVLIKYSTLDGSHDKQK